MPAGLLAASGIGALGSIAGGLIGSSAATSAANTQAQAQLEGAAAANANYQFGAARTVPFIQAGEGALNQLSDLYGIGYSNDAGASQGGQGVMNAAMNNFTNTPDYKFAFDQGLQAVDRSAAASGALNSGGAVKGATEFGQGLASQQFGNYFGRLLSLAGIGNSAAGSLLGNSIQAGGQQSAALSSIGASQAAGQIGSANSLVGGLNGASSSLSQGLLLNTLLANNGGNSGYGTLAGAFGSPAAQGIA